MIYKVIICPKCQKPFIFAVDEFDNVTVQDCPNCGKVVNIDKTKPLKVTNSYIVATEFISRYKPRKIYIRKFINDEKL